MPFSWVEYYRLACDLLSGVSGSSDPTADEARYRAAISRFYYAVYGEVRRFFQEKQYFIPQSPRGHKDVANLLKKFAEELSSDDLLEAYKRIGPLRAFRNEADYDDILGQNRKPHFQGPTDPYELALLCKSHAEYILKAVGCDPQYGEGQKI